MVKTERNGHKLKGGKFRILLFYKRSNKILNKGNDFSLWHYIKNDFFAPMKVLLLCGLHIF